jgi:hypothetical protein
LPISFFANYFFFSDHEIKNAIMSYGQSTLGEFRGIGQALPGDTRPLPGSAPASLGFDMSQRPLFATSAVGLTLTHASAEHIQFTGAGGITTTMPVATGLPLGVRWLFTNVTGGNVTITGSSSGTVVVLATNTSCVVYNVLGGATVATDKTPWVFTERATAGIP